MTFVPASPLPGVPEHCISAGFCSLLYARHTRNLSGWKFSGKHVVYALSEELNLSEGHFAACLPCSGGDQCLLARLIDRSLRCPVWATSLCVLVPASYDSRRIWFICIELDWELFAALPPFCFSFVFCFFEMGVVERYSWCWSYSAGKTQETNEWGSRGYGGSSLSCTVLTRPQSH